MHNMKLAFLSTLLCISVTFVVCDDCIDGWYKYEGTCYGFGDTPITFVEAEDMCSFYSAKLAELETAGENEFVKNISDWFGYNSVWIGGSDIFKEGSWQWVSTHQAIGPFTDWADGQPNDFGDNGEDCLLLWRSLNYTWADAPCSEFHNFVCEAHEVGTVVG